MGPLQNCVGVEPSSSEDLVISGGTTSCAIRQLHANDHRFLRTWFATPGLDMTIREW